MFPWDETDPATKTLIESNLRTVFTDLPDNAATVTLPDDLLDLVRAWHRKMLVGVPLEEPDVAGGFRGEGQPGSRLSISDIAVGNGLPGAGMRGVDYPYVAMALEEFSRSLRAKLRKLDECIPPLIAGIDLTEVGEVAILRCGAWVHGEWVRIHPFIDGNGRMARAWCDWVLLRYGMPPLLHPRPRPKGRPYGGRSLYEAAATQSMSGVHLLMERFLQEEIDSLTF